MGILRRLSSKVFEPLVKSVVARRLRSTRGTYVMNPAEVPLDYMKTCLGRHVLINPLMRFRGAREGYVGDYSYLASGFVYDKVYIGKFCSIANNVSLGPGNHFLDRISTYPVHNRALGVDAVDFPEQQPTHIGNDVWIGNNAVVMQGITVGDGAVIAAGCVVTRDVPPYAIVAGCPGKVLRYRHPEEVRSLLLELKWWDRDIDWIRSHQAAFSAQGDELYTMLKDLFEENRK